MGEVGRRGTSRQVGFEVVFLRRKIDIANPTLGAGQPSGADFLPAELPPANQKNLGFRSRSRAVFRQERSRMTRKEHEERIELFALRSHV